MTELSTEAKIEQAAKEYANTGSFKEWLKLQPFGAESSFAKTKRNFKAGVAFATTDPLILQGLLQPFAEWIRENYWMDETDIKKWRLATPVVEKYSTAELLEKYIHHLQTNKDKEDGK